MLSNSTPRDLFQEHAVTTWYFGNVPFESLWQRAQQLACHLAAMSDVVYVDPNRSVMQLFRPRKAVSTLSNEPLPCRLRRFQPCRGLPLGRSFPAINRLNYASALRDLERFTSRNRLGQPTLLVVSFPDQMEAVRALPGIPLVYDLMDEPLLFLKPSQKPYFLKLHHELLERAELTITSSRVLFERYAPFSRQTVCITNGVKEQLIRELRNTPPHPFLSRLPGPRIGYVGAISHWFDFDAVRALANAFPDGSVILVGPVDCAVPALPSNVNFTGMLPHHHLAPVLKSFDLGIIPFRRSPEIDAVNPIKLYEYLAAGLPVLTSRFTEMDDFGELVSMYDGQHDCATAGRALLGRRPSEDEARRRREFAAAHCWSSKGKEFVRVIQQMLDEAACLGV
jgi:glycosyltransferase involved in cell wall biosynthesis